MELKHIITSKIEHHAILHTCEYLEKQGFEVTYVDVDEDGVIKMDDLKAAGIDQLVEAYQSQLDAWLAENG